MYMPFQLSWRSVGVFWVMTALLNACLMTVEIVAGRLLAPFIGVSLIVWASIIGVVMLAMACGYTLGARLSSRAFFRTALILCVGAAALAVWGAGPLVHFFGPIVLRTGWPLPIISLLLTTSALFLPAFFLAATHPLLVRMATPDKAHAGRVVGVMNMAAALGSIVGTFMTGFVWLMWFSVPTILAMMAVVLLVLSLGFGFVFWFRPSFAPVSLPVTALSTRSSQDRSMFFFYALLAFLSGFSSMAIQVAAGRVLAPSLGTSVFTWTGVIGAILLGMTLGNVAGGILTDREGSRALLGKTFVGAGVAVLVAVYALAMIGSLFSGIGMPLALRATLFALIAFLPPAFAMAMVSPQLSKLALDEAGRIGSVVGMLTAANTLGGLAGAWASGFVLISVLGTRGLFMAMAILLVLVGVLLSRKHFSWQRRTTFMLVVLFLLPFAFPRMCDQETQYYCIQVLKDVGYTEQAPAYVLRLDHLVHSYVRLGHPEALGYGYEQVYAHLLDVYETPSSTFSSFFIGGGGYVLPRYIEATYPKARSVVSEIDPEVTEVNHTRLYLSRATKIETQSIDARMYLARGAEGELFDFVFGDAFNDFSVPYHLTTVEFHRLLKSHMSSRGVYALNIIDDPRYGQFLAAMVRTLREVWAHVYVVPGAATFQPGRNTIVLIASDRALESSAWRAGMSSAATQTNMDVQEYARLTQLMSEDKVEAFLQGHPAPPLTDAFVPTDRYLAPVFSDAY